MNIVDSSGWLEYFSSGSNAARFAEPLQDTAALLVPVITVYEVFKVVLRERGEHSALQAITAMQKGTVVDVTPRIALAAAKISLERTLPMADSLILATGQLHGAKIWTQDAHFAGLEGVRFFKKK